MITKPEKIFKKFLDERNFNYIFQPRNFPYRPDFLMNDKGLILNINGCFWHNHGCVNSKIPEKNTNYWLSVFEKNKARDYENTRKLKILGYKIINIWECVLRDDKSKKRLFNNLEKILQTV